MTITAEAPDFTTNDKGKGYPSAGAKIGPAWQACWDRLRAAPEGEYLDGPAMAKEIAEGLGMSPDTVMALLAQGTERNMLQKTRQVVTGTRGPRERTFYRINLDRTNPALVQDEAA